MLNGIAYDAVHDRLFVTGKLWPKIFEIEVIPEKTKPARKYEASNKPEPPGSHVRDHILAIVPHAYTLRQGKTPMDTSPFTALTLSQNAAILTIILAFAGYLVTFLSARMLARRRDKLRLVNKRLNEFYGPLYVASEAGNIAYRSLLNRQGKTQERSNSRRRR